MKLTRGGSTGRTRTNATGTLTCIIAVIWTLWLQQKQSSVRGLTVAAARESTVSVAVADHEALICFSDAHNVPVVKYATVQASIRIAASREIQECLRRIPGCDYSTR